MIDEFEVNTYGPDGRHILVLAADTVTAITAALEVSPKFPPTLHT